MEKVGASGEPAGLVAEAPEAWLGLNARQCIQSEKEDEHEHNDHVEWPLKNILFKSFFDTKLISFGLQLAGWARASYRGRCLRASFRARWSYFRRSRRETGCAL